MADSKPAGEDAPKKKSKLPIIIIAVVLLLGGGGGAGWFFLMKPKADAEHAQAPSADDHAERDSHAERPSKRKRKKSNDPHKPRQFVTLEPFVVNLRDTKQDRFAQVGVVFEVEDAKVESELNSLTPAIRDAMLMLISSKTANELLTVAGKKRLGEEMTLAANAILDGDSPPPIQVAPTETAAPTAPGGDPNNRFAPPDAHGAAPAAGHGPAAGPATPPNPYGQHAYGQPPSPYGAPNPYAAGNPYGAPVYDAYGRPIPPNWGAPVYDYPERVEATHFSNFIIQ
ncbi:MAG: flagellar basal body-associated FliL family protein [Burkholderiaceae bacterium]